ncbi:MAG: methyltransferase domain-containing protein [Gammaproteobacteria bacterium]|nr:methyltransferase domain-containing protein [Gammaproteobacteria bacterium]
MNQTLRAPHLAAITQLLGTIFSGRVPADRVLEQHFRANRNMGARDRGFVAEAVYGCLRARRTLEAWGGVEPTQLLAERCQRILVAYLVKESGWSARAIADTRVIPEVFAWVEALRARDADAWPLAVRLNLPDSLCAALLQQYGEQETIALAQALNKPAPVDMRVNTHKATREQVQAALLTEGIDTELTPYSPMGLRRMQRGALFNTRAFRDGLFELQDEGSQLLSYAVEPKRRQRVIDFCAGGGGKTLHLATLMENTGEVIAMDINERRLSQIKPRYVRAGLDNIRVVTWAPEHADALCQRWGGADRVLVDAPCSGTGTVRRNPDIKWRELDIAHLTATQAQVLQHAAQYVKSGGRLIYSTCSLLNAENSDIVRGFLAQHPMFELVDAAVALSRQGIAPPDIAAPQGGIAMLPHRHGTDGFYCAVMERKSH